MRLLTTLTVIAALALVLVIGCEKALDPINSNETDDTGVESPGLIIQDQYPAPSQPASVVLDNDSLAFWPYTGASFSGEPQDPINVIFFGEADPREIMQALLLLDGNRYGFPPVPPFTSTWTDAIGDVQTAWGEPSGWTGGVVQLACGDYQQARFHLRLFRMGDWTVGNAHFEVLIPGTTDHQVLNWELAEQFVAADLIRTGLLDETNGIVPTGQINDSPFRTIPALVYNGLPPELRQLAGGPLEDVTDDVPIENDGHALIFNLAQKVSMISQARIQDFVINFDQVIPKPFCASGPEDYVYVSGPVQLRQRVVVSHDGRYLIRFHAEAQLSVTPINPLTGEPLGATLTAIVQEHHDGLIDDRSASACSRLVQNLLPHSDPAAGRLSVTLKAGTEPGDIYRASTDCSQGAPPTDAVMAQVRHFLNCH